MLCKPFLLTSTQIIAIEICSCENKDVRGEDDVQAVCFSRASYSAGTPQKVMSCEEMTA